MIQVHSSGLASTRRSVASTSSAILLDWLAAESPFHLRSKEAPPASTIASMASAMPLPAATNTDGAAAKAADLARTEAESPFYTTKQGRAGAGHLLIDFRLHGKHWVLGGLYRSTVGFFFANENRRAKTHATTAETRRRQTHRPPPQLKSLATSRPETQVVHARNNSPTGQLPSKKRTKSPAKTPPHGMRRP